MDDYSNCLAPILTNLRDLGESLDEYGAVSRLLRSVPKDFYSLIFLFQQTSGLKTMRIEEAFGQLKVYEVRLQERNSRDEEQALLSRAFNKSKKVQRGSSSSGRGRGRKRKGKDHGGEVNEEKKKKQFDKFKVKCYNCQKLGILEMSVNFPISIIPRETKICTWPKKMKTKRKNHRC